MSAAKICPKCQGVMVEGFVVDHTYARREVSSWLEGEPIKSIWVGVQLQGCKPIDIASWRCQKCGFLENYASAWTCAFGTFEPVQRAWRQCLGNWRDERPSARAVRGRSCQYAKMIDAETATSRSLTSQPIVWLATTYGCNLI